MLKSSTISIEIKRNKSKTNNKYTSFSRYFPIIAQKIWSRKKKYNRNKMYNYEDIKYIESKILEQCSLDRI